MSPDRTLLTHTARFAAALRSRGVEVVAADQVDALAALELIDLTDPDEVRRTLRSALKIEPRHAHTFDRLFRRMWRVTDATLDDARRPAPPMPARGGLPGPGFTVLGGERERLADEPPAEPTDARRSGGYSPLARLRRKAFDDCTREDLAAMHAVFERIARRLATRRSRRLRPSRRGEVVDLRRSFRRALATDGDLVELARRRRAIERPSLVLLVDTSGSMDAHSRFLLAFAFALKRVAPRTEVFAFNTRLTRLTPWIAPAEVLTTLERLARGVPDWSGGTRIGESLMVFADEYLQQTVRSDTTVLILSDGLDRGDVETLERAMMRIRRRARQIVWLNPLMGDDRYRPEARGMKAALPFVDHLVASHDAASLEALLPLLAA